MKTTAMPLTAQEGSQITRMLNSALLEMKTQAQNKELTKSEMRERLESMKWFAKQADRDYFIVPSVPDDEIPEFRMPYLREEIKYLMRGR